MTQDDYLGIIAICGEEGTCKSSMALSFPKPIFHLDIDVGGFDRAGWYAAKGFRVHRCSPDEKLESIDWNQVDIVTKAYPQPIQMDRLLGQTGSPSTRNVVFPKRVVGMKELWQKIVIDFVAACQIPTIRTINPDSSTMLWQIDHKGVLQEKQERQVVEWMREHKNTPFDESAYRERLQPVEYAPANDRMRQVCHTVRAFRKNLVLTHYPTDEYGAILDKDGNTTEGKTGKKILDGFGETAKIADLIVWLDLKSETKEGKTKLYPVAKITKCGIEGMGLNAVGMIVPATFEGFINLRNMMRGVQNA